jgi:hypothetical protein
MTDATDWRDYGGDYDPPKSMVGPLFLGIVAQIGLLIGLRHAFGGYDADWALFLGTVLVASLPVPLLLWFALMRRREPGGWWKLPSIFLPLSFLMLIANSDLVPARLETDRNADMRRFANSMAAAGEEAIEKGPDIGELHHSGATGEVGEVERISLDFIQQIAADARAYQREIDASGLTTLFTDPAMRSRAGLPAARAKVAAARALIQRYSRLSGLRFDGLLRRVEHAPISPAMKAGMMEGIRRNMAPTRDYWRRMWAYETEAVGAYDTMLAILERSRWTRRGTQFIFAAGADSTAFNRQNSELDRIVAAQDALDVEQRSRARQSIGRLRDATR